MKKLLSKVLLTLVLSLAIAPGANAQTLKDIDDKAKTNYEQARQTYLSEIAAYKQAKLNFETAKLKLARFKSIENKAAYKNAVQAFLSKSVSALIKYLEALENKASNVRGISDSERADIIAYIDTDINWLKGKQTILAGTLTDEQLKTEAIAIRDYWKNVKTTFKKGVADIWIARVNYVISRAEELSAKVSDKIEELKAEGSDTAKLETWLAELNKNIATAKEKVASAKEKRESITDVNFEQMVKEIHAFVQNANQYIRKSHANLVQIVQEMKKITAAGSTNQ